MNAYNMSCGHDSVHTWCFDASLLDFPWPLRRPSQSWTASRPTRTSSISTAACSTSRPPFHSVVMAA